MLPLFVFGTLRHRPLLETVVGDLSHLGLSAAVLPGYAVAAVTDADSPTIATQDGAMAQGDVISGLTAQDAARLAFYEAAFGYDLRPVKLADGTPAQAYFPAETHPCAPQMWSLEAWVRDWAQIAVLSAREVMSYLGEKTPQDLGEMFPMIRARAWSRINAATSKHGARTLAGKVDIAAQRRVYAKYFALDEIELRHAQFDGSRSDTVARAVFLAADATLVLPYDPVRDQVLLVEQVRMGPLARGDTVLWQLEPIAGRLDPGEGPQEAARREALEEAGLEIGALHPVAEAYCSPGNSSEFYYIYVGIADLPPGSGGIGGLASEHEDIRSHVLSFDALMQMCADLQVANAPLVMAAYWLAHHRAGLRAAAGVGT